jgi:hypothetical protein
MVMVVTLAVDACLLGGDHGRFVSMDTNVLSCCCACLSAVGVGGLCQHVQEALALLRGPDYLLSLLMVYSAFAQLLATFNAGTGSSFGAGPSASRF